MNNEKDKIIIISSGYKLLETEKDNYNLDIPNILIHYLLLQVRDKGNIVYEYNPLHNFRYTDFKDLYGNDIVRKDFRGNDIIKDIISDLDTEKLNFDLKYPVNITCLPSYDGSVNLILNDNKNNPKLINTRFSVGQLNTYKVVDRIGNNDTNLYDEDLFDLDTSLFKRIILIPEINFIGLQYGGHMPVGNYNFYFKYSDSDGNETDFIGESATVVCHIGNLNDPLSIRGGILDEDSNKQVLFILNYVDSAYDFVNVYYTRQTSGANQEPSILAFKIDRKYKIKSSSSKIIINGFENKIPITLEDINLKYFVTDSVKTLATCSNRLFLGNLTKPTIDYQKFLDLSLRMLPYYNCTNSSDILGDLDYNYHDKSNKYGYYNVNNIYNKVGYWNEEMYRLGVVYIMRDDSLSPVFNIRGRNSIPTKDNLFSSYTFNSEDTSSYKNLTPPKENLDSPIVVDSITYSIGKNNNLENAKGVIRINDKGEHDNLQIYSLGIYIPEEVLEVLQKTVKGLFFVRLKRIPTILALAFTMGRDSLSGLPLIYYNEKDEKKYLIEGFIDKYVNLESSYEDRLISLDPKHNIILNEIALCPEFELKQPFFNNLFTDTKFPIKEPNLRLSGILYRDSLNSRHYYSTTYTNNKDSQFKEVNILSIADSVYAKLTRKNLYSSVAGSAEIVDLFKYVGKKFKIDYLNTTEELEDKKNAKERVKKSFDNNIVRGAYGPYLGFSGYMGEANTLYNIYIPGYTINNIEEYFKIRYEDSAPFLSISDRIAINKVPTYSELFRGDCYICNFTHRINRNFLDLSAPNADIIVDPFTWRDNYCPKELEKMNKINLGDLNAVRLGSWVTIKLCSNINLSMRDVDFSYPDEALLTGNSRTFYPLSELSTEGNFKIPESAIINSGISSLMSLRYNFTLPDVPYIKNVFENRIAYSNIAITDAFKNGYRVFSLQSYKDMPTIYGGIIKLIDFNNNLICIFEHGIVYLQLNERISQGNNTYINLNNVIPENPSLIISDKFGTLWEESVIKTPLGIYGVDTIAKKIWFINQNLLLTIISELKLLEFLNKEISLGEREKTPVIGIRNVKTHYNGFKGDVMFTFYDNLYGFEEKAWNLCYNEYFNKFITFYSWIPSYSENIDNIYFSFNRDTSKWISKLGTSNAKSNMADGVVLDNVIYAKKVPVNNLESSNTVTINNDNYFLNSFKSNLKLVNRPLPEKSLGVSYNINFKLERDIFKNYKHFSIKNNLLISNIIILLEDIDKTNDPKEQETLELEIQKELEFLQQSPAIQLNIKAEITLLSDITVKDDVRYENAIAYKNILDNFIKNNIGFYTSSICITTEKVLQNDLLTEEDKALPNLATHFWKHGKSGIIDIKESLKPCMWYGKQHPFEFEFVVSDKQEFLKIFDNLLILSNNVAPESIHYEIVGDCYDFKDQKSNIYTRQEFTKDLYQYNGSDIIYNRNALKVPYELKHIPYSTNKVKSVIFPLYYTRLDTINEVEDYYKQMTAINKDYNNLSGSEIVYYEPTEEFRIWNHTKACPLGEFYSVEISLNDYEINYIPGLYYFELTLYNDKKLKIYENSKGIFDDNLNVLNPNINPNITKDILLNGVKFYKKILYNLLRSNMSYNKDNWVVLINPIIINEKNEIWRSIKNLVPKIPLVINNAPVPDDLINYNITNSDIPIDLKELGYNTLDIDTSIWSNRKEVKLKDKYIKIRIRYTGDKLTLITAIKTLYRIVS